MLGSVVFSSMFLLRVLSILLRGMGVNWHGDAFGKMGSERMFKLIAVNIRDR